MFDQKTHKHNLMIHAWVPNLFDYTGGIQAYLQDVLKAIETYPHSCYVMVFDKLDQAKPENKFLSKRFSFIFSGNVPNFFKTFSFASQIIKSFLFDRPQLIICGHLNFSPMLLWIYKLFKVRYWVFVYGVDAWEIQDSLKQKVLKYAEKIISISHYTKNRIINDQNIRSERFSILPVTFDVNQFNISPKKQALLEQYDLQLNQPIILTVSRLVYSEQYKGYDRILQALPKIRSVIPNVHYLLVGKGDDRPRIEQMIQELQLENHVTLAGFVPDEELCDHYNLCDVFAMPSKREGFGIVYLEAMACGKPCLGGNQDGALDALDQGEIGVLVNPDDIDEIADALIQILEKKYPNPLLYQPEQLRQAVIDRFGFEIFQQRLHEYLNDFIACS